MIEPFELVIVFEFVIVLLLVIPPAPNCAVPFTLPMVGDVVSDAAFGVVVIVLVVVPRTVATGAFVAAVTLGTRALDNVGVGVPAFPPAAPTTIVLAVFVGVTAAVVAFAVVAVVPFVPFVMIGADVAADVIAPDVAAAVVAPVAPVTAGAAVPPLA